jgi:hypothetical protein
MSLREWNIDMDIKSKFFTASFLFTDAHAVQVSRKLRYKRSMSRHWRSSSQKHKTNTSWPLSFLLAMGGANLAGVTYHVVCWKDLRYLSEPQKRESYGLECAREDRDIKAPTYLLLLFCTPLHLAYTENHWASRT